MYHGRIFVLLVLAIFPVAIESTSTSTQKRRSFGESCDTLQKCDKSQWLSCQSRSCTCAKPDEMVYDPAKGKCVSRAGERCKFVVDEQSETQASLYEWADCVTNGRCSPAGVCACDPGFYETFNGTCLVKGDRGAPCQTDVQCIDKNLFLTCERDEKCGCGPSKLYQLGPYKVTVPNEEFDYDTCSEHQEYEDPDEPFEDGEPIFCQRSIVITHHREECVGRAEAVCNPNGNCVANSQCQNKICKCDPEYFLTANGECGYGFGQECDGKSKKCGENFICSDGKCDCRHPLHQEFDSTTKQCLSIVSGPCTADSDCNDHMTCEYNSAAQYGVCKCKPGFVQNAKGHCDLAHGSACKYKSGPSCDKGLKCRDGICSCPDQSMVWDVNLDKCVVLVDGRCAYWWNNTFGQSGESESESCTRNAECVMSRPRYEIPGTCQCMDGFQVSPSRECVSVRLPDEEDSPDTPRSTTRSTIFPERFRVRALPIKLPMFITSASA